jgi:4-hydroxy-tetrahydrodipicolinate synthase
VINRADWKYQNWLAGFNGGPLRQPTMKIVDRNMRILRDGLKKSGLTVTDDPDSEYFVSRNPE